MGKAGEQLRRDLDRFAHSIPGARVEKHDNVTTVHMPSKAESDLYAAMDDITDEEADLLDCMDGEDDW